MLKSINRDYDRHYHQPWLPSKDVHVQVAPLPQEVGCQGRFSARRFAAAAWLSVGDFDTVAGDYDTEPLLWNMAKHAWWLVWLVHGSLGLKIANTACWYRWVLN